MGKKIKMLKRKKKRELLLEFLLSLNDFDGGFQHEFPIAGFMN